MFHRCMSQMSFITTLCLFAACGGTSAPSSVPRSDEASNDINSTTKDTPTKSLEVVWNSSHAASEEAIRDWESKCSQNDADSCFHLGVSLAKKTPERAVKFWDKACRKNDARACANLGASYITGMGVKTDFGIAAPLLVDACLNGIGTACSNVAMLLSQSDSENAEKQVKQMLLRSCLLGEVESCEKIGAEVPKKSLDDQKTLVIRCHEGDAKACFSAGLNLHKAIAEIAVSFYKRGCDMGDAPSCSNLGGMYYLGTGVDIDKEKAIQLFDKSCHADIADACWNLAQIYRSNNSPDLADKAKETMSRACKLGRSEACEEMQK